GADQLQRSAGRAGDELRRRGRGCDVTPACTPVAAIEPEPGAGEVVSGDRAAARGGAGAYRKRRRAHRHRDAARAKRRTCAPVDGNRARSALGGRAALQPRFAETDPGNTFSETPAPRS